MRPLAYSAMLLGALFFAAPAILLVALHTFCPGIGDEQRAMRMIQGGETKEQVLTLFGPPHNGTEDEDQWTYRCDPTGGTLFRVYFGRDDRVTHREWWAN